MNPNPIEIRKSSLRNDAFDREAWLEEIGTLIKSALEKQWEIGDCALRIPSEASRDEVKDLLEEAALRTGYDANTIRDLRTVAERIPERLRNRRLSFSHHKAISKLVVVENGRADEEKSLALRDEFIQKFASDPKATVGSVREAVAVRMNKTAPSQETVSVSFRLPSAEYETLESIVEDDPVHDSVSDFVRALVRNRIGAK